MTKGDIPPPVAVSYPRQTTSYYRRLWWPFALVALYMLLWATNCAPRFEMQPVSYDAPQWALEMLANIRTNHKHSLRGKRALKAFLKIPNESSALATSRHYTSKPHIAGNEQDLQTALDVLKLAQKEFDITVPDKDPIYDAGSPESQRATLGIASQTKPSAWIDCYYPVLNTPADRSLEIVDENGDVVWSADLKEHVDDDTDPIAREYADAIPTFHGLSADGEAKGKLVYANLGRKQDYDALVASGVNFNNKIVIVRYGGIFRGLKVKFAQELGAAAVLIYSDPRDDGSVTVSNGYEPYPHGPARNPTSVQRGSVQFLSLYPGDPTTPGYPSYPNATRTSGENIPKIPSLPISWSNAERLLEEIGSGNAVRLVNKVNTKVTPIWNTMAVIPGHIKNEVVFLGNHRDAWVLGGADPTSGTVSMNEVIKGYGSLLRHGWRPLRTIIFASWDAEEYGLVGSTEYGEDFADWIKNNVVAYLNLDSSVSGSRFHSSASPSLADLVRTTAETIEHPTDPSRTLWDARQDTGPFFGLIPTDVQELYDETVQVSEGTGIGALGSGSDYTVFLQRIGIASLDGGFGTTLTDAVYHYHSIYDSQHFQETYADKGFHRHVTVAKHLGTLGLRLADSIILPINTSRYCSELAAYSQQVASIARTAKFDLDLTPLNSAIDDLTVASIALDKEKTKAEKKFKRLLRKLRRRSSSNWLKRWYHCVVAMIERGTKRTSHSPSSGNKHITVPKKFIKAAKHVQAINKKLSSFESGFISEEGIKDREWYKHLGTAPGKNLGYGATTLPALTEAITIERNSSLAHAEVKRLEHLISQMSKALLT